MQPESAGEPVGRRPRPGIPLSPKNRLHTYTNPLYIYSSAVSALRTAPLLCLHKETADSMKFNASTLIREVLASSPVANQDELRRKLRRRGIQVTQATLSRDIHELRLSKGPGGYSLPNGHTAPTSRRPRKKISRPPSTR